MDSRTLGGVLRSEGFTPVTQAWKNVEILISEVSAKIEIFALTFRNFENGRFLSVRLLRAMGGLPTVGRGVEKTRPYTGNTSVELCLQ